MPFKPNSFFKFNVNHYDFFINLRDLHKIFYTLWSSDIYILSIVNVIDPNEERKYLKYIFAAVSDL